MGYKESMRCLLKSFMCELYGVIGRYISVGTANYSQGHNLFKGFLDMLTSVYPKPRSVSQTSFRILLCREVKRDF